MLGAIGEPVMSDDPGPDTERPTLPPPSDEGLARNAVHPPALPEIAPQWARRLSGQVNRLTDSLNAHTAADHRWQERLNEHLRGTADMVQESLQVMRQLQEEMSITGDAIRDLRNRVHELERRPLNTNGAGK